MTAYNPNTGQRTEISEYGFEMLQRKGWVRSPDQTPLTLPEPEPSPAIPAVNMAEVMEARKKENEAKKLQVSEPKVTKPKASPGKAKAKQTTKSK